MSDHCRALALIPARAGSVRVPGKNMRLLGGKPLLAYTIEAALEAHRVSRVIVSTDSEATAMVARQFGAETPFLRPAEIAQSHSTEMEFFDHALSWLRDNEGYVPDLVVLLYPTSPFRRAESIDAAIETMLERPDADSLRSVTLCKEHPCKMWSMVDGLLEPFVRDPERPDAHTLSYSLLPEVFIQNASIYIARTRTILEKRSPTGDVIVPFVMSEIESTDINTPLDFAFAELLLERDLRPEEEE